MTAGPEAVAHLLGRKRHQPRHARQREPRDHECEQMRKAAGEPRHRRQGDERHDGHERQPLDTR